LCFFFGCLGPGVFRLTSAVSFCPHSLGLHVPPPKHAERIEHPLLARHCFLIFFCSTFHILILIPPPFVFVLNILSGGLRFLFFQTCNLFFEPFLLLGLELSPVFFRCSSRLTFASPLLVPTPSIFGKSHGGPLFLGFPPFLCFLFRGSTFPFFSCILLPSDPSRRPCALLPRELILRKVTSP